MAVFIHLENIDRDMGRVEAFDPSKRFVPGSACLVRQPGNQIEIDIADTRPSEKFQITFNDLRGVAASGAAKFSHVKGLNA
jgi:hypothetical protein